MTRRPDADRLELPLGARVPAELIAEIDAEREKLRAEHPGIEPSRSDVVRALLLEALAARRERKT